MKSNPIFRPALFAIRRFRKHIHFNRVALTNALGLINEHGIETLLLDPASSYNSGNPWPNRFLLVQRGASGYQYGDLAGGGSNLAALPLGPSPDAPYNSSDPFAVRRLGAHPGLELGIASGAITIDHLVVSTAAGKIADANTIAAGTYWVVGRAAGTVGPTAARISCRIFPWTPTCSPPTARARSPIPPTRCNSTLNQNQIL